jgi:hypothetical protein
MTAKRDLPCLATGEPRLTSHIDELAETVRAGRGQANRPRPTRADRPQPHQRPGGDYA